MISEKPLLLNAEMVRALHAGIKTQTRRPMRVQPREGNPPLLFLDTTYPVKTNLGKHFWKYFENDSVAKREYFTCPFGVEGGQLWVRETFLQKGEWITPECGHSDDVDQEWNGWDGPSNIAYAADPYPEMRTGETKYRKISSIHMNRRHSRTNLLVKRVWVERVQDISQEDALAEGIIYEYADNGYACSVDQFETLWDSIYAGREDSKGNPLNISWNDNPYVWACEFSVI